MFLNSQRDNLSLMGLIKQITALTKVGAVFALNNPCTQLSTRVIFYCAYIFISSIPIVVSPFTYAKNLM